jgi:thiamine-monophosphate kinase
MGDEQRTAPELRSPGADGLCPGSSGSRPVSCDSLWREEARELKFPACEADCLALIDEFFPCRSTHVPYGRGDDCALLLNPPRNMLLSTDMFWQDIHFRTSYFTPEEAGGKALAAAVSDLAAAGAAPLAFSLGLMLPRRLGGNGIRGVLRGMAEKAREYGIFLSGGDLSRGEQLGFSVTVWGENPCPGASSLRRGRAGPGDFIFLVGESGLAGVGLWAFESWGRSALDIWPKACMAHLAPRPLLAEGRAIALLTQGAPEKAHRIALMDLSDGPARDLPRLLGGLGADLDFDKTHIPSEVLAAAEIMGVLPEELFLAGGEDYALIGSCAEEFWPCLQRAVPQAALLGRAAAEPGLRLRGQAVFPKAFDHFSDHAEQPAEKAGGQEAGPALPEHTQAARAQTPPRTETCGSAPDSGLRGAYPEETEALISLGRDAWSAGLLAGFNGNISCRVSLHSRRLAFQDECTDMHDFQHKRSLEEGCLITRTGAAKGRLTACDFALLDMQNGRTLEGAQASTESAVHLAVYAACPQSRFILHAHPPFLLALSLMLEAEKRLVLPLPEAEAYCARLGHACFQPPGSAELAEVTAKTAQSYPAVWMERHGLVVHAKEPGSALALAEELEQLAKIHLVLLTGKQADG